jgi:hypothetical protein
MSGSKDRKDRLNAPNLGQFETTSQDFLFFALRILEYEVNRTKLEYSSYCIYAIIPLLSSSVKCLYLEAVHFSNPFKTIEERIEFKTGNELLQIAENLNMPENYLDKLKLFCEIRNEIIHPVHYGVNSQDNIPEYLKKLGIEKIITDKTTRPLLCKITDWEFIKWCFEVIESLAIQIIKKYYGNDELLLQFENGYQQYKTLLNGI